MRWPSAKSVSNASELFPEPDKPVITTSLFLGIATLKFLRLLTRALFMMMYSLGLSSSKEESLNGNLVDMRIAKINKLVALSYDPRKRKKRMRV
jgi:hypothetical protein